jgi:hypothetical protein
MIRQERSEAHRVADAGFALLEVAVIEARLRTAI